MQNTVPPRPPGNPQPPENIPPFPGVSLRVGSTGASVRQVQEAINKLAQITPGMWQIAADGIFGNGTRDAVMAFQRIFGLTVDGIVGPITWNRLMQEANITTQTPQIPPFPGTNLGVGSSGTNVRLIQEALNTLAPFYQGRLWMLTVDGMYGNMTRDAIYAFQSIFGLPLTGVVNEATWNRLMQEAFNVTSSGGGGGGGTATNPAFPGNLSIGSTGVNVRLVQEAINALAPHHQGRLWILTVDGNYGPMTRDAIYTFQSIFGLPITGVVNETTWNRLMQEAESVRGSSSSSSMGNSMGSSMGSNMSSSMGNSDMIAPQKDWARPMDCQAPKADAWTEVKPMDCQVPKADTWAEVKPMDMEKPKTDMDMEAPKDDMKPMEKEKPENAMKPIDIAKPHPYDSLPYGTGVSQVEPMGMKFSERELDRDLDRELNRELDRRDHDYDYRDRFYDRAPDRRGYGYGYRERNYCDVRGRYDGRCSYCGLLRKDCTCGRR
ncbi:MAG: peptidoglycan-binding protein [Lachnospiraceae bacterium]|nr:peptidoglycan-binding protein [Lachnospiraceae bacterium]